MRVTILYKVRDKKLRRISMVQIPNKHTVESEATEYQPAKKHTAAHKVNNQAYFYLAGATAVALIVLLGAVGIGFAVGRESDHSKGRGGIASQQGHGEGGMHGGRNGNDKHISQHGVVSSVTGNEVTLKNTRDGTTVTYTLDDKTTYSNASTGSAAAKSDLGEGSIVRVTPTDSTKSDDKPVASVVLLNITNKQ